MPQVIPGTGDIFATVGILAPDIAHPGFAIGQLSITGQISISGTLPRVARGQ